MKLSELIIDFRKRMNISQREFSRMCDLSNTYISFIEKEINPKTGKPMVPTLEQYKKIADGMGISVQRLFELLDKDSPVDISFPAVESSEPEAPNDDLRVLFADLTKLSPDQQKQARQLFRAAFMLTNPELFTEGDDDK